MKCWVSNTLIPLYDLDGTVCGIEYNGTAYYFYKNLQGDVIAITDDTGATVAKYRYDAWGKCTIVSDTTNIKIATINPFRYRSYYYDHETSWYYLQSRYYDPNIGRFINRDAIVSSFNLFFYCNNNCVMYADKFGYAPHQYFLTIDAATHDFAINYNRLSINEKREYGSAIYAKRVLQYYYKEDSCCNTRLTKSIKYYYAYTKPAKGSKKSGSTVIPNLIIPLGTIFVSTIHTHGNYDKRYKNEVFSSDDMCWANAFHMDIYVVTPGGFLKKYYYRTQKTIILPYFDIPYDFSSPDSFNNFVKPISDFYTL